MSLRSEPPSVAVDFAEVLVQHFEDWLIHEGVQVDVLWGHAIDRKPLSAKLIKLQVRPVDPAAHLDRS